MKILGDVVPAGLVGALFVLSALTGAYAQDAADDRAAMGASSVHAAEASVLVTDHEYPK